MTVTPDQLIRPEILALSGYHVPPSAGMVKLDAMENPYRLPEGLRAAMGALASAAELNRYPDPGATELKRALRESLDIPDGQSIVLGNGSDELIQMIALAVARSGATLMAPEPSFVVYRMVATLCGLRYVGVPLREGFGFDREAMLTAIERERPAVIFLAYPNNPTGNLYPREDVEAVIGSAPGLVVLDEAYHAFAGESFLPRLRDFGNLLVMRTLSKLGLAGLRLGLLTGAPRWLDQIEKLRLPYNVGVLPQALAVRVLRDVGELNAQAARIVADRAVLVEALAALPGVRAFPTQANFVLFRVGNAPVVHERLKAAGILIKNLHGSHPMLENCLRVTVGTTDENAAFLSALKAALLAE